MDKDYVCSEISEGDDITTVQLDVRESDITREDVGITESRTAIIEYAPLDYTVLRVTFEGEDKSEQLERAKSEDPTKYVLRYFD